MATSQHESRLALAYLRIGQAYILMKVVVMEKDNKLLLFGTPFYSIIMVVQISAFYKKHPK